MKFVLPVCDTQVSPSPEYPVITLRLTSYCKKEKNHLNSLPVSTVFVRKE
jgi:hypothetical protein